MKRYLAFIALFLCTSLSSCQCAEQPDVGPVEDGEQNAQGTAQIDVLPASPSA